MSTTEQIPQPVRPPCPHALADGDPCPRCGSLERARRKQRFVCGVCWRTYSRARKAVQRTRARAERESQIAARAAERIAEQDAEHLRREALPPALPEIAGVALGQARSEARAALARMRSGSLAPVSAFSTAFESPPSRISADEIAAIRRCAEDAVARVFPARRRVDLERAHEALNRAAWELADTGEDTRWIGQLRALLLPLSPRTCGLEPSRFGSAVALGRP